MSQIMRCPLVGTPCMRPITIQEKAFFLAEAEDPEYDRQHRGKAVNEAIVDGYQIRSALEEKGINAFTCKICEMIQTCAYGMADISQNNANVFMELGMMLALGKPTIILAKKGQEEQLKLPSDVTAIEIIPFEEYLDIIDQLREVVRKLPPIVLEPTPIQELEKIQPQFAAELRTMGANIVKEFKNSIEEAKLNKIPIGEEKKKEISSELDQRLGSLEEKLEDMIKLGFTTDAETANLRGHYYFEHKKYNEALAAYNWALELQPDDPDILNNRGNAYHHLERYNEALDDYNRALSLRPDDPVIFYNIACTFSIWKKFSEALDFLKKAVTLDSEFREMAKTDEDFDNIRDDPQFKKLTESD